MKMEIRPGDGGADAEAFASELAAAIAKGSKADVSSDGTTKVLHRL